MKKVLVFGALLLLGSCATAPSIALNTNCIQENCEIVAVHHHAW